jgi:hypothetical protein
LKEMSRVGDGVFLFMFIFICFFAEGTAMARLFEGDEDDEEDEEGLGASRDWAEPWPRLSHHGRQAGASARRWQATGSPRTGVRSSRPLEARD